MKQFRKLLQIGGSFLATAALAGLMMCASVPMARADDDHAKCQHRIEKADHNLDVAVHKHGEHSPQAEQRRRELNDEREHCWNMYHGYWNSADHSWHAQRDWDNH